MKQTLGLALFCFAVGMLVMLVIDNSFIGLLMIIVCLAAGYYLYCYCD